MPKNHLPEREYLTINEIATERGFTVDAVLDCAIDGECSVFVEVKGKLFHTTTDDGNDLPECWRSIADENGSWTGYAVVEHSDLIAFRRGDKPECKLLRVPDLPDHELFVVLDQPPSFRQLRVKREEWITLTCSLEYWFDKKLDDLPDSKKERVERDFNIVPWDELSPEQRRSVAAQMDARNDPVAREEQQRDFDLECEFQKWEQIPAPTASDLAVKERRLSELRQERARLEGSTGEVSSSAIPTTEQARQGGKIPKYNTALQTAINRICAEIQSAGKKPTLGSVREWFTERRAVSGGPLDDLDPWESEIAGCEDLYIDGRNLVWKDRDGRECAKALRSLDRYLQRYRKQP